jgi:hypothetical protein
LIDFGGTASALDLQALCMTMSPVLEITGSCLPTGAVPLCVVPLGAMFSGSVPAAAVLDELAV